MNNIKPAPVKHQTSPPLAHYRPIDGYVPSYGDFIIWSGWFTTWHGVVSNFDSDANEVTIIFSNVPYILFTYDPDEQIKESRTIKLNEILSSRHGTFAVMKHDYTQNASIWYI